jgi:L-lactate dehydrogenase (cytochrome)
LDGVPSTTAALPAIVDQAAGRMTILADGGVRSGLDVMRMLALGADAVLLGRAWVYALAGAGEAGIDHVLALIEAELRVAMALTGCTSIDDISQSNLVDASPGSRAG